VTSSLPTRLSPEHLEPWHAAGVLSSLDVEFAELVRRLEPSAHPLVGVTAALVSRATQAGHVCLDLDRPTSLRLLDRNGGELRLELPNRETWKAALRNSALIGSGGEESDQPTPLVMVGSRVYLHRYFAYERRLEANLTQRLTVNRVVLDAHTRARLTRLFPESSPGDLQRRAALLACLHRFCVISGGPGTGKTTTVAKVLALLAWQFEAGGEPLRLRLLAPTGKAATRLAESLNAGLETLPLSESVRASLTVTPSTIHRALGYQPRTPTRFRHNAQNPLPANVVVVDEAAMVDLSLMTKLCEAVAPTSHLILLGDRDQLASVEAGAVFGDLFNANPVVNYSARLAQDIQAALDESVQSSTASPPIGDCTIHLEKSYRYAEQGGIAKLARAIRAGDVKMALQSTSSPDIRWLELPNDSRLDETAEAALRACVAEGFAPLRQARTPEERLVALSAFRLLSPHRRGALGVDGLNALAESVGQAARPRDGVYAGQPILINENDYQAELFNGDVGIVDHTRSGKLAAFFPGETQLRQLSLARLPAYSTVYAMTIHKSQGSEFDRVVVVLPHHSSPLLSRELLYTGITRAKTHVTLISSRSSLEAAIEQRVDRCSGLRGALWGE
jgi:exodeoxyribonuclease V alpha subunit